MTSVAPTQQEMASARYKDGTTNTTIIGTTPAFAVVRNYQISSGRFFDSEENKLSSRVAVVGHKIVESLFRRTDPVGKIIRINSIPFRIVGTLKAKGMSYDGVNQDDEILIPLNTALQRVFNINYIGNIYVEVSGKDKMAVVEKKIRNLLRERHELNILGKADDFTIQNIYTTLKVADETNASFTSLIGAIAALSLLVGGVGILAVMLLSVKERTSEIGLRMAVGAKPGDVLFQFFLEAAALSSAGGIVGIVLGFTGVYLLKALAALKAIVSPESVIIAVIESVFIGVLFGSLPARKASLVQPVKALKE